MFFCFFSIYIIVPIWMERINVRLLHYNIYIYFLLVILIYHMYSNLYICMYIIPGRKVNNAGNQKNDTFHMGQAGSWGIFLVYIKSLRIRRLLGIHSVHSSNIKNNEQPIDRPTGGHEGR